MISSQLVVYKPDSKKALIPNFLQDPNKKVDISIMWQRCWKRFDRYSFIYLSHRDNVVEILFFFGEMNKVIHTQEASFDFYQFLGKDD